MSLGYSDEHYDPIEDERDELMAQDQANKSHARRLARNPDCRDPDHDDAQFCLCGCRCVDCDCRSVWSGNFLS